jgi:hypothetical protein
LSRWARQSDWNHFPSPYVQPRIVKLKLRRKHYVNALKLTHKPLDMNNFNKSDSMFVSSNDAPASKNQSFWCTYTTVINCAISNC